MAKFKYMVSLQMRGRTDEEIRDALAKVEAMVKDSFGEDAIRLETHNKEFKDKPLKGLSASIGLMADANLVIFVGDYTQARGCKIEHEIAERYSKPRMYVTL